MKVQSIWKRGSRLLAAALAVSLILPFSVAADDLPNADQTSVVGPIVDPTFGFWTAVKTVQIFNPANASNPCPDTTKYCYVYTIANDPSSQLALVGFGVQVPAGTALAVQGAGYLPGAGVVPDSTNILANEVRWEFGVNVIPAGSTTEHLYINSTYGPGNVKVTINGDGGLDAGDLDCLGPVVPPSEDGEPQPCTIGFWKNRYDGKQGTLQWFPGAEFNQVVTAAVALSGGVFTSNADLLFYLSSKGPRPILTRAKQQLAAFLLNMAAGDLFPDNMKCRLFDGNFITTNACGNNITIGAALVGAISDVAGDEDAQHDAHDCSDDVNNGIGVIQ